MKKLQKIFFTIVAFIGVFGYNLSIANETHMFLDPTNDEIIHNMAGIEYDNTDDIEDDDLEGLGRVIQKNRYTGMNSWYKRQLARSRKRRKRRKLQVTRVVTNAHEYIIGSKAKLGSEVQKFLGDGKGKFTDGVIYFTKGFDNLGSIVDVIKSNDSVSVGYSNLEPNGIVPIERTLAVKYISLLFNEYNEGDNETLFTNDFIKAHSDPRFANAELEVLVSKEVVFNVPVCMLNEPRVVDGKVVAGSVDAGFNLTIPVLVPGNKSLDFQLKMADGTAITNEPGFKTGLKFILAGAGTRS